MKGKSNIAPEIKEKLRNQPAPLVFTLKEASDLVAQARAERIKYLRTVDVFIVLDKKPNIMLTPRERKLFNKEWRAYKALKKASARAEAERGA